MKRLQRLRATPALRDLVSEIGFGQGQLIQPLFLAEGVTQEEPLSGLPGTSRHTLRRMHTRHCRGAWQGFTLPKSRRPPVASQD